MADNTGTRREKHCVIERRRRERTNMLFHVLKQLVPGCDAKLSLTKNDVLEYSIDYIRILESHLNLRNGDHLQRGDRDLAPIRMASPCSSLDSSQSSIPSPKLMSVSRILN